ncbi:hypothetical protein AUC70_02495 [Methyloceanibacter stevinii]|uniref:L,D-TPase catalytic domain-containing protein n=1 Tax=Methyloceanibacter stevinii TaxID=1774970 RepID=A0A1E3VQH3_9HYPH|nr:L,D-transpeptidase [Methyloceanibacter stevinii]ODR95765.1 hypothetical protein AUC70_02495 [Methyloceanibacter stevinii]
MTPPVSAITTRALALFEAARARPGAPQDLPGRLFVVDVERQTATLIQDRAAVGSWPVSTALKGIGGEENSFKTPPGWHRIDRKIGAGAEAGTVFSSREPTGERWQGETCETDLILTRILTLDGLEDGVNRGPGCDSRERYIYIHGSNHEEHIGRPASCGCVRMSNADVTALFDAAQEGDLILIAPSRAGTSPSCRRAVFTMRGSALRHERPRPVSGDEGRTRERQRPRLRPG